MAAPSDGLDLWDPTFWTKFRWLYSLYFHVEYINKILLLCSFILSMVAKLYLWLFYENNLIQLPGCPVLNPEAYANFWEIKTRVVANARIPGSIRTTWGRYVCDIEWGECSIANPEYGHWRLHVLWSLKFAYASGFNTGHPDCKVN